MRTIAPAIRTRLRPHPDYAQRLLVFNHAFRTAVRAARRPRILVYPQTLGVTTTLYRVLTHLGVTFANKPANTVALAVKWDRDATWFPDYPVLRTLDVPVINGNCMDISKTRVDQAMRETLGRQLAIDPQTYDGPYVVKSDANAAHDGLIANGISQREEGKVYHRLVDASIDDRHVMDLRVPIIGNLIPLVYRKRRPKNADRFQVFNHTEVDEPHREMSSTELADLLRFARCMRLDYCELDVLRDTQDGLLYVVDANASPTRPSKLSSREYTYAIRLLAAAWDAEFLHRFDTFDPDTI